MYLALSKKNNLKKKKSHLIQKTHTKQISPSSDHEAVLLQMHQLQSDIEACNSQAVEKEEMARKEIDELKLQVQECMLAREHEKNVSAIAKLLSSDFLGKSAVVQEISLLSYLGGTPVFVALCLPKGSCLLSDL